MNADTAIFANSRIVTSTRYGKEGAQASGQREGAAMTVAFELDGQPFTALNGGPRFTFNEAISLVVNCRSREEVDHNWNQLPQGGDERAQQCGWLKDRSGLFWQVVPTQRVEWLSDPDPENARRATA